jgi:glycerate kinase
MSRTIMIMVGGTGSGDFGSGITRAARALACAEDMAWCLIREPVP